VRELLADTVVRLLPHRTRTRATTGYRQDTARAVLPCVQYNKSVEEEGHATMILRLDKLPIQLPEPKNPSPNSAAAVQELLGGRFGEMSTLMNYTFQSFNFRGRDKLRPYYDLIANIAAEEYSHIELVS